MDSLGGCIRKYKDQIRSGEIVTAYRGIMKFMTGPKKSAWAKTIPSATCQAVSILAIWI